MGRTLLVMAAVLATVVAALLALLLQLLRFARGVLTFPLAHWAIAGAIAWWLMDHHSGSPLEPNVGYLTFERLRWMLFDRGPIPILILWVFLVGVVSIADLCIFRIAPLARWWPGNGVARGLRRSMAMFGLMSSSFYGRCSQSIMKATVTNPDEAYVVSVRDRAVTSAEEKLERAFTPLTWCQAVLPLLGFIGTIIGLAKAMNTLGGELLRDNVDQSVLEEGFKDVALAFDTTFLGLVGLVLILTADTSLRRWASTQLAAAGQYLDQVVDGLSTVSVATSVRSVLGLLEGEGKLRKQIILEGSHPVFEAARDALLTPFVEFDREHGPLAKNLRKNVAAKLHISVDEVKFGGVGTPLGVASDGLLVAAYAPDGTHLFAVASNGDIRTSSGPYDLDLSQSEDHGQAIFPTSDLLCALVVDARNNLIHIKLNEFSGYTKVDAPEEEAIVQFACSLTHQKEEVGIIIYASDAQAYLQVIDLRTNMTRGEVKELPGGHRWTSWDLHSQSATLFGAGQSQVDGSSAYLQMQVLFDESSINLDASTSYLDLNETIASIHALRSDEFVFVTRTSRNIFNMRTSWGRPRQLHPPLWKCDRIVAVARDWVAVLEDDHYLRMWRFVGGRLLPFHQNKKGEREHQIHKLDLWGWQATANGERLCASTDDAVVSWSFPRTALDED